MQGEKIGSRAGLVMVDNPYSTITASSDAELTMVESLLPHWQNYLKDNRENHG